MKELLYFAVSVVLGITLLFSCKKEDIANQQVVKYDGFSLIEGRLAFDSEASFNEIMAWLYLSQDSLDKWEMQIPRYISMRTRFEKFAKEDAEELIGKLEEYKFNFTLIGEGGGELSMERNLYNDVLATVVNQDGYLQIGNTVYRFIYTHYYSGDISDIDLLNAEDFSNPKVTATKIKREFVFEDIEQVNPRYTTGECTTTSGNKRVKGLIVREEFFGSDCNIITKHQRKVLGVWLANSTSISVSFSGNFVKMFSNCNQGPNPYFADSGYSGNSSSITRTVPANHPSWNGCNGDVSPFHNGVYLSTHVAGGKTCTLSCPPLAPCN